MTTPEVEVEPRLHDLPPAADPANATRTMGAALRRALTTTPTRTAVVCPAHPAGEETYTELADRVARLGAVLAGLGLSPGDRVAVLGANCHRYVELYLGLPTHGFVIVPLNVRHTAVEREYALRDAGVRVLFADRALDGVDGVPGLRVVDLVDEYDALLDAAPEPPAEIEAPTAEHDLAGIFYTGGTTGRGQGRDAHPRQPGGQRLPLHGVLAVHRRDAVAGRRADVPRRRHDRDARRPSGPAARRSSCRRSPPTVCSTSSSAGRHRDARRAHDDGRARR